MPADRVKEWTMHIISTLACALKSGWLLQKEKSKSGMKGREREGKRGEHFTKT
jgi:hypothetical protein